MVNELPRQIKKEFDDKIISTSSLMDSLKPLKYIALQRRMNIKNT